MSSLQDFLNVLVKVCYGIDNNKSGFVREWVEMCSNGYKEDVIIFIENSSIDVVELQQAIEKLKKVARLLCLKHCQTLSQIKRDTSFDLQPAIERRLKV